MSASIVCSFFLLVSGLTAIVFNNGVHFGIQALSLADRPPKPTNCVYNTVDKMLQAECTNLNLDKIPPTLRQNIQVLDFSGNRLKKTLKDYVLSAFTSLSYIYFTNNLLTKIEDGAFVYLKKLKVLDLTSNILSDIPKNIFALPDIRKLYLSDNEIGDSAMDPTPFAEDSSLEFLDVSKNHLTKLPRLGILPNLKHLNVSENSIKNFKTEDIAAFCSLQILDLSQNPIILTNSCECQAVNVWVIARSIKMFPPKFDCTDEERSDGIKTPWCTNQSVNELMSNETLRIFENCKNVLETQEQIVKTRYTWILTGSCITAVLVCIFIIYYCIHRCKKEKSVNIFNGLIQCIFC